MKKIFHLGIYLSPPAGRPKGRRISSTWRWPAFLFAALLPGLSFHPLSLFAQALTSAQLLNKSGFVFQGTVKKLQAATEEIPVGDRTAIVHVDSILDGAQTVGNFKGRDVTLRLSPGETAGEGESRVFYVNPYTFRKTAGFDEVGSQPVENAKLLETRIPQARLAIQDKATGKRLATSDLVVIATVGKVGIARGVAPPAEEHDPNWFEAVLKVETTEKGLAPAEPLTVLFADNNDSRWFKAPKLTSGERAIFLLQTDKTKTLGVKGYFVVDPSDVRPLAERERVHGLLLKVTP